MRIDVTKRIPKDMGVTMMIKTKKNSFQQKIITKEQKKRLKP